MSNELQTQRPLDLDYEWVAIYSDKTELPQNYGRSNENGFNAIDQNKLKEFWLQSKSGDRDFGVLPDEDCIVIFGARFFIEFPHTADDRGGKSRLVYFRRIRNDVTLGVGTVVSYRHCIGLQKTVAGRNYQQIVTINPDGTFSLLQVK